MTMEETKMNAQLFYSLQLHLNKVNNGREYLRYIHVFDEVTLEASNGNSIIRVNLNKPHGFPKGEMFNVTKIKKSNKQISFNWDGGTYTLDGATRIIEKPTRDMTYPNTNNLPYINETEFKHSDHSTNLRCYDGKLLVSCINSHQGNVTISSFEDGYIVIDSDMGENDPMSIRTMLIEIYMGVEL